MCEKGRGLRDQLIALMRQHEGVVSEELTQGCTLHAFLRDQAELPESAKVAASFSDCQPFLCALLGQGHAGAIGEAMGALAALP